MEAIKCKPNMYVITDFHFFVLNKSFERKSHDIWFEIKLYNPPIPLTE